MYREPMHSACHPPLLLESSPSTYHHGLRLSSIHNQPSTFFKVTFHGTIVGSATVHESFVDSMTSAKIATIIAERLIVNGEGAVDAIASGFPHQ